MFFYIRRGHSWCNHEHFLTFHVYPLDLCSKLFAHCPSDSQTSLWKILFGCIKANYASGFDHIDFNYIYKGIYKPSMKGDGVKQVKTLNSWCINMIPWSDVCESDGHNEFKYNHQLPYKQQPPQANGNSNQPNTNCHPFGLSYGLMADNFFI